MNLLIFFQFLLQFQVLVGLSVLLAFSYYLWVSKNTKINKFKGKGALLAPQAAGAWPIVGHLPQLVGPKPLFRILGAMADNYGPIFMLRFGVHPTVVVSSWEMTKECFTTNDRHLASRPSNAASQYLIYEVYALFGFSLYGSSYWRDARKIATLELLSHRRLELLKHVPYTEIDTCIKQLHRLWTKNNKNQNNPELKVEMNQFFTDLTMNVILKLVVGKRFFNVDDAADHEKEEARKIQETIFEFFKLTEGSVSAGALPLLNWLDLNGQKRAMKRTAKKMDSIAEKLLDEHRQKRLSKEGVKGTHDHNDFMDVLLSILDADQGDYSHHPFNYSRDHVIKATTLSMILSSMSISVSLSWALSLLLNNRHVLKKAQDELDMNVGKDRQVEEGDIKNLVYLQAIVKETFRMYPANPLLLPHEAIEDCKIGGFNVPAGTRVVVNAWKLQHDPRVWSNPSEFKPERFLNDQAAKVVDVRGQNFEYLPFGSGRRVCPGISFSLQTIHMSLARLVQAFELGTPSNERIDMTEGSGLTMPKTTPLHVLLNPRLPLPLYE